MENIDKEAYDVSMYYKGLGDGDAKKFYGFSKLATSNKYLQGFCGREKENDKSFEEPVM